MRSRNAKGLHNHGLICYNVSVLEKLLERICLKFDEN